MKLTNNENRLIGQWVPDGKTLKKDDVALRIEWLISNHLRKIMSDDSGWSILYINPDDNQFWELTYPQSELQGGGPPSLTLISAIEAKNKYHYSNG
jgi:hypothetical protein